MLTVAELIRYRMRARALRAARWPKPIVPTAYGEFRMIAYESEIDAATRTSRW